MVASHYRSPINYSTEIIEQCKAALDRLYNCRENLTFLLENAEIGQKEGEATLKEKFDRHEAHFIEAMDDDFNTADALAAIFELVKFANSNVNENSSRAFAKLLRDEILQLMDVMGLIAEPKEELLDADIEKLIEERQAARKAKNFARADEIRNELLEKVITLLDTREGVKWKRA